VAPVPNGLVLHSWAERHPGSKDRHLGGDARGTGGPGRIPVGRRRAVRQWSAAGRCWDR